MNEYRVETVLTEDRTLKLENLPFQAGDAVEVIIVERPKRQSGHDCYPLHGQPIRYDRPTDPVADEEEVKDWLAASRPSLWELWDNKDDADCDSL